MKQLKNKSILMLVITTLMLASACSKDKDNNNESVSAPNISQAVGTWMCTESTDNYLGQSVTGLLVGTEITIMADGTYTSTAKSGKSVMGESGTWSINGNIITAKTTGYTFLVTATINENKMIWDGTASNGVNFHYVFLKEG